MIRQNTVFLENQKGRLSALCRTLGDSGVNMDGPPGRERPSQGRRFRGLRGCQEPFDNPS